jgi:uncharacterized membrane protein
MSSLLSFNRADGPIEVVNLDQAHQQNDWRHLLTAPGLILIVYFFLAFYRIGHQSLWVDEVRSLEVASPAGSPLTGAILLRGQGPLYFILLHLWAKLAAGEAFLRALSALLGSIAVLLTYLLGCRLCNQRAAKIGATLFATSPILIWYSQEVRYITLLITAALLTMLIFVRALSSKRLQCWLLYCCSLILAISAFPTNIFLSVTQGLYLIRSPCRRPLLRKWAVCQLPVLALFVLWMNNGHVRQLGEDWYKLFMQITTSSEKLASLAPEERLSTGGSREFTVMAFPYTFFAFSTGFSLGPSLRELHSSTSLTSILLPHAFILVISGLLFGNLFLLGVATLWHRPNPGTFLALWLAVPIIGVLGISALIPEMAYNVRYVAMGLPAYFLILASGIAGFRRPMMRIVLLAAVLLVNGLSLANYYYNPRYSREDAKSAARLLEAEAHPRDVILVVGSTEALEYYYRGSLPIVSWDEKTIHNQAALLDRVEELSQAHDQAWFVAIRPWESDPAGNVKAALEARFHLSGNKRLPGVDIAVFQLK